MKVLLYLVVIIFISSCYSKSNSKEISILHEVVPETSDIEKDTIRINGQYLVEILYSNHFRALTNILGDTIIRYTNYYQSIEYLDINKDGFKDIRVYIFSNSPNQCENYFFDKKEKLYKLIKNCNLDIQTVEGTNLFYSYNSIGCADMNWESHLSKIENWTEVNIGVMNVNDCGDKYDGIKIYEIKGEDERLIKTMPILHFDNNGKNNKWDFIKKYWAKNYHLFRY